MRRNTQDLGFGLTSVLRRYCVGPNVGKAIRAEGYPMRTVIIPDETLTGKRVATTRTEPLFNGHSSRESDGQPELAYRF